MLEMKIEDDTNVINIIISIITPTPKERKSSDQIVLTWKRKGKFWKIEVLRDFVRLFTSKKWDFPLVYSGYPGGHLFSVFVFRR